MTGGIGRGAPAIEHGAPTAGDALPAIEGAPEETRRALPGKTIMAPLDDHELARVDALARARGISREETIGALVVSGVAACEAKADKPVSVWLPRAPAEDA